MKKSFDIVFGITEKQYKCIRNIEFWTTEKFTGITRKDASKFIAQHRRDSQKNEFKHKQKVKGGGKDEFIYYSNG